MGRQSRDSATEQVKTAFIPGSISVEALKEEAQHDIAQGWFVDETKSLASAVAKTVQGVEGNSVEIYLTKTRTPLAPAQLSPAQKVAKANSTVKAVEEGAKLGDAQ